MQMIYFRNESGIQDDNPNNGHSSTTPSGPWWTGYGPHQPLDHHHHHQVGSVHEFTILTGDYKNLMPEQISKLGFPQPAEICAKHQITDPRYGVLPAYSGPHFPGGVMLPLKSSASEGLVIYVNPKQYLAIIRRRESRAKAMQNNRFPKIRKPYMHESRHLHAKRRPRGCGGRFLNTKTCSSTGEAGGEKKSSYEHHSSSSQSSEVLQAEKRTLNLSRPGDRAANNSYLQPFHFSWMSDGKL
ncbi:hypothetical protein SAY86_018714 [Trapa natans]|uniref:Nuclear transcription factor Y subunit n=1 Tax=Trapa natans TaxID=22666 RepID=A0AAN7LDR2_TRANT|nr:hypothetical protein SAY86_018714 [Trapa natans]